MSVQEQFQRAVNVVRNLPKNGSFQPSNAMKLRFYSLFKQAMEGPCRQPKPSFWEVAQRAKWDAWSRLGNMSKEQAMERYVYELRQIVETMSYCENVANFVDSLDGMFENVSAEDLELLVGPIIQEIRSRPNSPLSGSPLESPVMSRDASPNRVHHIKGSLETSPETSCSASPQSPETDTEEEDKFVDTQTESDWGVTKKNRSEELTVGLRHNPNDQPQKGIQEDRVVDKDSHNITSVAASKHSDSAINLEDINLRLLKIEKQILGQLTQNSLKGSINITSDLATKTSDSATAANELAKIADVVNNTDAAYKLAIIRVVDHVIKRVNAVEARIQHQPGCCFVASQIINQSSNADSTATVVRITPDCTVKFENDKLVTTIAFRVAVERMTEEIEDLKRRMSAIEIRKVSHGRRQPLVPKWWELSLPTTAVLLTWPILFYFLLKLLYTRTRR